MLSSICFTLLKNDLLLAYRKRSEIIQPIIFFLVVVILFPLAITPEQKTLITVAPGIIWIATLLATFLSLPYLFQESYADGSLEQLILSGKPLSLLVLIKLFSHWLTSSLPLVIIAPALSIILHLSNKAIAIMLLSLLLGTPTLILVGAIGAALVIGLKQGGLLLALVILPLYIPILILGAGTVIDAQAGLSVTAPLTMLAAILVLAVTLAPFAIAGVLRAGIA